jgi:hypothetical protein
VSVFTGAFWPSPQQELILQVALAPEQQARAAWERLSSDLHLDSVVGETARLLPLLYDRLSTLRIAHRTVPVLKGFYRHTWYKNQLLMRSLHDALVLLDAAGIDTMILKGAALNELYYKSRGLRPMVDVDLLVRRGVVYDALTALTNGGWAVKNDGRVDRALSHDGSLLRDVLRDQHGVSLISRHGDQCDLHWRVGDELALGEYEVDDMWDKARPLMLEGIASKALCAADTLLNVCVHGARWNEGSHLRWLADAAAVVWSGEVDWDRVVEQAELRRCVLPMRESLTYLSDVLCVEIPPRTIHELQMAVPTRRERFRYRARAKPPSKSWRGNMAHQLANYLALNQHTPPLSLALGFPRHLQRRWGLSSVAGLPRHAIRIAVRNAAAARASRVARNDFH